MSKEYEVADAIALIALTPEDTPDSELKTLREYAKIMREREKKDE